MEGQRLIVVHAGGVEEWVEGVDLVFKSKTNLADYHDKINHQHYNSNIKYTESYNMVTTLIIIVD